jgi:GTPase SAR1 family protein
MSRKTDIFIVVFAVDEVSTFKAAIAHVSTLKTIAKEDVRFMLVGNKCDAADHHVSFKEAVAKAAFIPSRYTELTTRLMHSRSIVSRFLDHVAGEMRQQAEFRNINQNTPVFWGLAWPGWFQGGDGAWADLTCGAKEGEGCVVM